MGNKALKQALLLEKYNVPQKISPLVSASQVSDGRIFQLYWWYRLVFPSTAYRPHLYNILSHPSKFWVIFCLTGQEV